MKLRIALFVLSVAAMAAFGLFTQAKAGEDLHAVYGIGSEPCSASLKYNWTTHGEAAWIGGYMSLASELAPRRDMDPWHKNAQTLIALVYRQCKHDPSLTISLATGTITNRILARQGQEQPEQEGNPNESLERAPL
jgi:hypothetical protein